MLLGGVLSSRRYTDCQISVFTKSNINGFAGKNESLMEFQTSHATMLEQPPPIHTLAGALSPSRSAQQHACFVRTEGHCRAASAPHQHPEPKAPCAPLLCDRLLPAHPPRAGDWQASPAHQDTGRDGWPGETDAIPGTGTHPCQFQVAGSSRDTGQYPLQRSKMNLKSKFLIQIVRRQPSQHNHVNKIFLKFTFSLNWGFKLSPLLIAMGPETANLLDTRSNER